MANPSPWGAGPIILTVRSFTLPSRFSCAHNGPPTIGVMPEVPDIVVYLRALEPRTLKRALTDPRLFSGIGNAYSDEILHRARLSPFQLAQRLSEADARRLHEATRAVLEEWTERLTRECGDGFPEKVTAFRPEMAVHGRFGKPCPACGSPVQRIVYADEYRTITNP